MSIPFPGPGIHFGLNEETYHDVEAFSSTGIKKILVSPLDYWMSSPMNPSRKQKETAALAKGKAHHKMHLEGEEAFDAAYAVEPSKDDYDSLLVTNDDLCAYLLENGGKKSGTKADLIARIREFDTDIPIWDEILREFAANLDGRIPLKREDWNEIQRTKFVIDHMPSAKKAFGAPGAPEVSIFWVHELGVKMKARIDLLQVKATIDAKSFANQMDKEIVSAVAGAVGRYRYDIQPLVYLDGLAEIKKLYAQHGRAIVDGNLPDHLPETWLDEVMACPAHRFFFAFLQTGDVPNLIIREFRKHETYGGTGMTANAYWQNAALGYRVGVEKYKQCMAEYGPDRPWVVDYGISAFRDDQFPLWMLNEGAVAA